MLYQNFKAEKSGFSETKSTNCGRTTRNHRWNLHRLRSTGRQNSCHLPVVGGISAACGSTALVLVPLEFQIARNYPIQQPTIPAVLFFSNPPRQITLYRSMNKKITIDKNHLIPEIFQTWMHHVWVSGEIRIFYFNQSFIIFKKKKKDIINLSFFHF